jgi:hypothetical protein
MRGWRNLVGSALRSTTISIVASLSVFGSAHASCSDRPGTPAEVQAVPGNGFVQLSWTNTASESIVDCDQVDASTILAAPAYILDVPKLILQRAPLISALRLAGGTPIYLDIYVREGAPNGRAVGLDRTGFGPFVTCEHGDYKEKSNITVANLVPGRTYCFAMRARTEAGTQGCVSERASNWSCATIPLPPAAAVAPALPAPKPIHPLGKQGGSTAPAAPEPAYEAAKLTFDILPLQNRVGGDYTSFEITTGSQVGQIGACAKACLDDQGCQAWAYVRPGFYGQTGGVGRCWLKNQVPAAGKDICCWTGVRKASASPPSAGTATVIADVDVYDAPGGNGNVIGALQAGRTVQLLSVCVDNWCNVAGNTVPGGRGWVYDGPDYVSLQY